MNIEGIEIEKNAPSPPQRKGNWGKWGSYSCNWGIEIIKCFFLNLGSYFSTDASVANCFMNYDYPVSFFR